MSASRDLGSSNKINDGRVLFVYTSKIIPPRYFPDLHLSAGMRVNKQSRGFFFVGTLQRLMPFV